MHIQTCTDFNGLSTDYMMSDQCLVAQGYFCSEQVLTIVVSPCAFTTVKTVWTDNLYIPSGIQ